MRWILVFSAMACVALNFAEDSATAMSPPLEEIRVQVAAGASSISEAPSGTLGDLGRYTRPVLADLIPHEEVVKLTKIEEDPVEQVHLSLGAEDEVIVSFASKKRSVASAVLFWREDDGSDGEGEVREARGEATTYANRLCPSHWLRKPRLITGKKQLVSDEELAAVVNTSRLGIPTSAAGYVRLDKASDAWLVLAQKQGCIAYQDPLGYYESPYLHTVVLTGLLPRTTYYYRPVASNRTFSFTTLPRPGQSDPERPLMIAAWADIGTTTVSRATMLDIMGLRPDLLLTVGDYSYSDGWAPRWDTFGTMAEPLMATVPGLGVIGNHEMDSGRGQSLDWLMRYPHPYRESGSTSPLMYSYDAGLAHILALPGMYAPTGNGTDGSAEASSQYLFAVEDLARVDRAKTPWIVVMFHAPWYNSNVGHHLEALKHQWDMEELFHEYGVDVILSGHVHAYERTHPVYKYEVNPCGVVQIIVGDGGNYEGPNAEWLQPRPSWSAFREASFGGGALTVLNSTHARWSWRRSACVSRDLDDAAGDASLIDIAKWTFTWDGTEGSSLEQICQTSGDDSKDARATVDEVMLVRDVAACPNRERGAGSGSGFFV